MSIATPPLAVMLDFDPTVIHGSKVVDILDYGYYALMFVATSTST
jgi:hypothetical protein